MRLFYDHQVTSLQDAGGASRYHYELLRCLRTQPEIAAVAILGANVSVLPYRELANPQARIYSWPTRLRAGYLRYAVNDAFAALLAPAHGRFDVYHASYYRALPFVRRRKLVVTHHDCVQERFPHLFRNAAAIMRAKRRLFAQADRILCVSAASRDDLLRFYPVERDRTEVIHHGFTRLGERAGAPAVPARAGAPPANPSGEPYLLYVGSRAPYKNFMQLLDAFAASGLAGQLQLKVAGGGPWSAHEQQRLAELGLTQRVHAAGRVTDAQLAALYRSALLFVYPSLCEGFGFPPLEAMSEGCPVLVSGVSSLPEICGEAAFYFDPADPGDLARQLQRLAGDPILRNSRRAAGFEQIGRYQWQTTALATLEAYRRVLA